jgi:hypothetical protein
MGSVGDIDREVQAFAEAVGTVPAFNISDYVNRLKSAALTTYGMRSIASYFSKPHRDQPNCVFGGTDCTARVEDLGLSSTAYVLGNSSDGRNFHSLANKVSVPQCQLLLAS